MATTQINNPIDSSIAARAAAQASENAVVAAKAATDSATMIAVVANDVSWIKGSLKNIEVTLNDMSKAFVTAAQHSEVCKKLEEHETRLNGLSNSNTRQTAILSIGTGLVALLVSIIIYHLVGK